MFRKIFSFAESDKGWEKWQIALLITPPIIAGAAYYYYYRRKTSEKSDKKEQDMLSVALDYKVKGNKYFKDGDYSNALIFYTKAIKCCPIEHKSQAAIFYQNRAASYEMLKQYENVVENCSQAIQLDRKYTKAYQRRAKANESLDKLEDALVDITAVDILEQFQNHASLIMTERVLKKLSLKKAKCKLIRKEQVLSMPPKYSIRTYFRLYSRDPIVKDPNIDEKSLMVLLNELKEKAADGTFNDKAKMYLLSGSIELLKGNNDEGIEQINKIFSLEDVDTDVKVNALIKLGANEKLEAVEALSYFQKAIDLDPKNQDIYLQRAQVYLLNDKINESCQDIDMGVSLDPNYAPAVAQQLYIYHQLASTMNDLTKLKELNEKFIEATKKFPHSSDVHSLYAQALMNVNEIAAADEHFLKAIECDPENPNLFVRRAILYSHLNDKSEEVNKMLKKALDIDNTCQFALEILGTLEIQNGRLSQGIVFLEKAINCAQSESDLIHLFSLKEAAVAQYKASALLGIKIPFSMPNGN